MRYSGEGIARNKLLVTREMEKKNKNQNELRESSKYVTFDIFKIKKIKQNQLQIFLGNKK